MAGLVDISVHESPGAIPEAARQAVNSGELSKNLSTAVKLIHRVFHCFSTRLSVFGPKNC
jgi:hypothetical protein